MTWEEKEARKEKIRGIVKQNMLVGEKSTTVTDEGIAKLAQEFGLTTLDEFGGFYLNEVAQACVGIVPKRIAIPRRQRIVSVMEALK